MTQAPSKRIVTEDRGLLLRAKIFTNPALLPAGAVTNTTPLDSGGTVFRVAGPTPPKVASTGRLTVDPGSTIGATSAGYLHVRTPDGLPVTRMGEQVAWPAGATGAAIAFVVPSAAWDQSNGQLPVAGVHLTNYGNGIWNCAVWNPAAGQSGHYDFSIQPGTATTFTPTLSTTTPNASGATAAITTATATAASVQAALVGLNAAYAGKITVTKSASGNYGVALDQSLGASTLTAVGTGGTMGMAAPTPVDPTATIPAVVTYGAGLNKYGEYTTHGRYGDLRDGTLRWQEVFIDPDRDRVMFLFPDGVSNSGWMYHPGVGLFSGFPEAVFEWFNNNVGAIDTPATGGRFYADSVRKHMDTLALSKIDVLALIAAGSSQVLYDGYNNTTADITITGSIPSGAKNFDLCEIGGAAGAGSGGSAPAGTAVSGGASAGSAGIIDKTVPVPPGAVTWQLTIGKKGTGGAAVSATGNGNPGLAGGLTKFSLLDASGNTLVTYWCLTSGVGAGGQNGGTAAAGGGAGGPFATGGTASAAAGGAGAAGGGITANLGVPASGSGGGITSGDVPNNGGPGGSNLVRGFTGGTAGIVGGANPGVGTDAQGNALTGSYRGVPGPGVGGGAASTTGPGQAGASSVMPGVGGAGGGAARNGNPSGKGGDGGGGYARVVARF